MCATFIDRGTVLGLQCSVDEYRKTKTLQSRRLGRVRCVVKIITSFCGSTFNIIVNEPSMMSEENIIMTRKRTITWYLFRFFPTSFYKTNYILETAGRGRNNIMYTYI